MKSIKNISPGLCGLFLIIGASAVISVESAAPRKKYIKELEEAFAAKLADDQDDFDYARPASKNSAVSNSTKEIGPVIVFDIKQMKNDFIELLSTSELASPDELKTRVDKADKSFQLFKAKYSADLSGSQPSVAQPLPVPVTPPPPPPAPSPMDMGMGAPGMMPPPPAPVPVTPPPPAQSPMDMGMSAPGMMPPPPPPASSAPAPSPMDMGMGAPGMMPPMPSEPAPVPVTPPPPPAPSPMDMGMGAPGMMPPPPDMGMGMK